MKLIDYRCDKCNMVEERLVSNDEVSQTHECGHTMTRMVSAPGMVKTNFADKTGFKKRT